MRKETKTRHRRITRIKRIAIALGVVVAAVATWYFAAGRGVQTAAADDVVVYKSAQCGCCAKWVDHMRVAGFKVVSRNVVQLGAIKSERGVPAELGSCHTAVVNGYTVEGHVPAAVVQRLLRERPDVRGIAVPGMPAGSPGMEGAGRQPYAVLAFDAEGRSAVYERR